MQPVTPIFKKSILIFSALLTLCASFLVAILIVGETRIGNSDKWVQKSRQVILEAEELTKQIEGLLASQRGLLLTGTETFRNRYNERKEAVTRRVVSLGIMVQDNEVQTEHVQKLGQSLDRFVRRLDERIKKYAHAPGQSWDQQDFITGVEELNVYKDNTTSIITDILENEYDILDRRIRTVEKKKSQYFKSLIIGSICSFLLLLISNGFLFYVQGRRSTAERSLKSTEERFKLAIEGTSDGIFDWNLVTKEMFYSRQFFAMLGYDRDAFTGTIDDSKDLIHPDDVEKVWEYVKRYLKREVSAYSNTFRMRHASGDWVWINSRAKAVFGPDGRAIRMVGAHTDVTFMKEYQEKLKAEKDQAARANMAKTEFLAHMSHEIRTPLSAISGIAEIFRNSNDNFDPKQKRLINILYNSTVSLKDLVDDVLDFSRIESGEIELREAVFDPIRIFEEVISVTSVNAHQKGLKFNFDYAGFEHRAFRGDPTRLRQILVNLISNAVKFTEKGSIDVTVSQVEKVGNSYMCCAVRDTGIGIPQDKFGLIFERFKQGDSSVSRRYGGTGLGLSISSNLAQLMGGEITVESTVGTGSVFTLCLPLRTAPAVPVNQPKENLALDKKISDKIKKVISGEDRILIVEDYEGNVAVLSYILDEISCQYDVARTGTEGFKMWQEKHYDVVLMDIQMPEMDGFETTAAIREAEDQYGLSRTPIIGLTAHALIGDESKCIEAGMDAYLPKPIVAADLKKQILDYLLRKRGAAGNNKRSAN